ncbi:dynein regulatory complex subunit 3-like [Harmonia axyridis]|uniref:dynein regulatory complex subunit 3-like n=1 Tax=Harmonia axyridis TaxID=115357 RepID=UPI001E278AB8|nr:dynein regulatory complex subunit 3-like [Harmonia axyridis]
MSTDSLSDSEDEGYRDWGKFLKNRICEDDLPGIINNKLLEDILHKQMEGSEIGRLMLEDGISFEKVTEIRIEFCNILRIDHIWMMKNLKTLKMDNNYIEKIENLESLTQLIELDLSFNKITKIENLDSLINLRKLSLFDNAISKIENLDKLKQLTIFSIGKNFISDWKDIVYLRRLPQLRSLNMAENSCCAEKDFKYYVATYLPNLEYYEYRYITKIERQIGDDIFHDDYLMMLEEEKVELETKYNLEREEYEGRMNAKSFVEYLNTRKFFDSLFENDPEGSALLLIGGDVTNLYVSYEENIVGLCKDIFKMGQEQYSIRNDNYNEFNQSVKSIQKQNQDEGIAIMESFLEEKTKIFDELKDVRWQFNDLDNWESPRKIIREFKHKFEEIFESTWKSLMKLEAVFNEQIMELNETYEQVLTEMINNFVEHAQGMFVTMREVVTDFNDNLQQIAPTYYATVVLEEEEAEKDRIEALKKKKEEEEARKKAEAKAAKTGKNKTEVLNDAVDEIGIQKDQLSQINDMEPEATPRERVPSKLRPYVKDRETLVNALASSRDVHLLFVDNREDLLVSRAREWLQETIKVMNAKEITRNRDKILEITHFLKVQHREFEQLLHELLSDSELSLPTDDVPVGTSSYMLFTQNMENE